MVEPYYQDAVTTIYHGKALPVLADVSPIFDAVVTDPPYGIGWKRSANPVRQSKAHDGIEGDQDTETRDQVLALYPSKPAAVFGSFYAPQPLNVRQVLVWHKPADAGVVGSTTGYRRDAEPVFLVGPWPQRTVAWPSVFRSSQASIKAICAETGHPHTKPVDIMRTLVERCPGRTILDPFMGSGSTLVAAKQVGRSAIGIELDERYCEVAARRLSQEVLDFGASA